MGWAIAAQVGGSLLDSWIGADSQHKANRMNLQLQREQQKWEADMANTAIQRRRADFEKAGFNPVLAATGVGAATPSLAPAQMQPEWSKPGFGTAAQALATAAQIKNTNANTAQQLAQARITNVEADIRENLKDLEQNTRSNREIEEHEWDDLKTKILRNTESTTASQAKQTQETVESMIDLAKQQAREGKINLDALENIAKLGGIELGKATPIVKAIFDMLRPAPSRTTTINPTTIIRGPR